WEAEAAARLFTLAAPQAAGFEMPAFSMAAANFSCWVMSPALEGALSPLIRITSGVLVMFTPIDQLRDPAPRIPAGPENSEVTPICSLDSLGTGVALQVTPGL